MTTHLPVLMAYPGARLLQLTRADLAPMGVGTPSITARWGVLD
jgi:predicted ATPase